jgi:hypothetical protein
VQGTTGKVKTGGKEESAVVVKVGDACLDLELLTGPSKGQVISVAPADFSAGQLPAEKQAGLFRRSKKK